MVIWGVTLTDDPRMDDGGLDFNEMSSLEAVLFFEIFIGIFWGLFWAIGSLFKEKKYKWAALCFLFWPSCYIYLFKSSK